MELAAISDHMEENLQILFVGYNPSIRSGETGHHYANPSNRFYRILLQAGLTPRLYKPQEDGDCSNRLRLHKYRVTPLFDSSGNHRRRVP